MKKIIKFLNILLSSFVATICVGCNKTKKITINFIVDEYLYSSVIYNGEEEIKLPENPVKEDYTFEGWYWDKDTWKNPFSVDSLKKESLSPEMNVYAHFINESYLSGTDIDIKGSEKINMPGIGDVFYLNVRNIQLVIKLFEYVRTNPQSTWFVSTNITGSDPIVSKTISLDVGDSSLYYLFVTDKNGQNETYFLIIHRNYLYNVNFNSNGGSTCKTQVIEEGFYVENIPSPSRTGYTFLGWNYDFASKPITSNVNASAMWDANSYSVTYDPNGGTISAYSQSFVYGKSYSLLVPEKKGYNFICWKNGSQTVSLSGTWNFSTNLELVAEWEIIHYSISYTLNGGSVNSQLKYSYTVEDSFVVPMATKHNYTFNGWSTSSSLTNPVVDYVISKGTTGNIELYAKFTGILYQITYDVNSGNPLEDDTQNVRYGDNYQLITPTKNGYHFDGWFNDDVLLPQTGIWSCENVSLVAHWSIVEYSITYNLNNGTNNSNNPSTYTIESTFALLAPTKEGYTFTGWFDDNGNQITQITAGMTGALTLTAYWNEGNIYTITLNPNSGEVSTTSLNVQYDQSYSLPIPTRAEYNFDGWYGDTSMVNQSGTWNYATDMTLTAHWSVINYSITYNLNDAVNSSLNPSTYNVESPTITLDNPTKTGYTFIGWFDDNGNQITQISSGMTGALTLTAHWSAIQNILSVTSEDTSKGTVAITSGSGKSGESITVIATPIADCVFKGWYHDDIKVSNDATYTFIMPTNDYSLVAHFFTRAEEEGWIVAHCGIPTLSEDGKTITYGLYPQTYISNSSLTNELNKLITPESNGWYLYNDEYYAKVSATPYTPSSLYYGYNKKFDDGTTIVSGRTYWFKCEPIVWNVLSKKNGEYYILSSVLLDAHCFHSSTYTRTIDGNTVYVNNYEYSDIRAWLNNDFYNSAFALGNSNIQTTTVDNSAATTVSKDNPYACNNTQDKVFLPSYQDYKNSKYGFEVSNDSSNTRYCKTTDWAKARGAASSESKNIGMYWTRSPEDGYDVYVWYVHYSELYYEGWYSSEELCVRPAISITVT